MFLWVAVQSCSLGGGNPNFATECRLPANQSGTLVARWLTTPIPIAFGEGEFSGSEIQAIVSAMKTWNTFYQVVRQGDLFDFGPESNPNTTSSVQPTAICASSVFQNNQFTGEVTIRKRSSWAFDDSIIALTSVCPVQASGRLDQIYQAIMEFNYENFFVPGTRQPDLQTIATHEFGHLIGMGHSCETFDKPGFPNCQEESLDPDYLEAQLFPIVFFPDGVNGEVRPSLERNDQERSLCLSDEAFNAN